MNRALLAGVVMLVALIATTGFVTGDWEGADHEVEHEIEHDFPEFEPWITPVWEPPSHEVKTLLFSLQTGIGALIIGYYVGAHRAGTDERD